MPYTGRLANPDARLGNIKLGVTFLPAQPPPPPIDVPTTLFVDPHLTSLAVADRTNSVVVFPRTTTLVVDG